MQAAELAEKVNVKDQELQISEQKCVVYSQQLAEVKNIQTMLQ